MEDSKIVALYHARSESAIAETAKKYGAFCLRVALNLLGIREDADECVNDTYMAAWTRMPPELPASLRAFLGRITRNIAINTLRDARRQKRGGGEAELALDELAVCLESGDSPERTVEDAEIAACIDRWLDALPREQRVAFVRRYWYLDSIQTLASRMGWTTAKTASLLMRLRASLRKALISEGISI